MISDDYRFMFIDIPGNSNYLVKNSLFCFSDNHLSIPDGADLKFYSNNFPNQTQTHLKFCIIRNPFSRVVQTYISKKNNAESYNSFNFLDTGFDKKLDIFLKKSFKELLFSGELDLPNQFDSISIDGKILINFFIRFEQFSNDFKNFLINRKIPHQSIINNIKIQEINLKEFIDEDCRKYILKKYEIDFDKLFKKDFLY